MIHIIVTRHGYQRYAISTEGVVPENIRELWEWNFRNYINPEDSHEEYWAQPIEADAWAFAEAVVKWLWGGTK